MLEHRDRRRSRPLRANACPEAGYLRAEAFGGQLCEEILLVQSRRLLEIFTDVEGREALAGLVEEHFQLVLRVLEDQAVQLIVEEGRLGDQLVRSADLADDPVALTGRFALQTVPGAAAVQRTGLHFDAVVRELRLLINQSLRLRPERLVLPAVRPLHPIPDFDRRRVCSIRPRP